MELSETHDIQYIIPSYKCILLGEHRSGKTSLTKQLINAYKPVPPGKYHKYVSTRFTHMYKIIISTNVCDVQFKLYDTPPNSVFYRIYEEVDCCIVLFDYMRNSTFQAVAYLVNSFKQQCPMKPVVICGNKRYDNKKSINVNNLMKQFGDYKNIHYCELCIQNNSNLMKPFQILLEKLTIIPRIVALKNHS